jgi:RNA polymerase sigma-70 factor (ECF subfamily)
VRLFSNVREEASLAVGDDRDSGDAGALIARVALGDRKAFAALYHMTNRKLFGVCLRMIQDRADAEEALQEVYVKIWKNAATYRPGLAAPTTWLVTIARNHALDVLRRRRQASEDLGEAEDFADPKPGPEAEAIRADDGRRIEECMNELEPDRAAAVRSAYVEGLSYLELAGRHGVPLNTMRTWLRRSLLKLRECMDQ